VADIGPGGTAMAMEFVLSPRYPLLQLRDTLLGIRCFDGAKLRAHEGRQAGRDPGMNSAGGNIRDQASHRIPHRLRIVQGRQRIHVFAGSMVLVPAPDPAQFGSLIGIGVEKAQAARGGGCPACSIPTRKQGAQLGFQIIPLQNG
jgi:hypothetical protein